MIIWYVNHILCCLIITQFVFDRLSPTCSCERVCGANSLKIKENNNLFADLSGNIWYFENFCVFLHKINI